MRCDVFDKFIGLLALRLHLGPGGPARIELQASRRKCLCSLHCLGCGDSCPEA